MIYATTKEERFENLDTFLDNAIRELDYAIQYINYRMCDEDFENSRMNPEDWAHDLRDILFDIVDFKDEIKGEC